MADLTEQQSALPVKISGADLTGAETNYMDVDGSGRPTVKSQLYTAAASAINFGQALMAASLPVVLASNQSAIAIANFPTAVDTNFGAASANTIRVASLLGNATGAADFNAGATGAQTLRAVANQGAPNTAANGWFTRLTDGTNNVAIKVASTAAVAADPSLVVALSPNSPLPAGSAIIGALSANQTINLAQVAGTNTVTGGVAGLLGIGGNVASGATDAGNPIKVGGVFNTAQPTVTNGQRVDLQSTARGAQIVATGVDPFDLRNITGTISLPTGAATETTLSAINTKLPTTIGQKTMAASLAVVLASDQSAIPVVHIDTAPATQSITAQDTGTSTFVGANGQNFYTGSPTTNSAAVFALSSISTVTVEATLLGGGGTMVVEVSVDGGTFWLRPNVFQVGTTNYVNSFASPFVVIVNVAGCTHIRVRAITAWAGTATIAVKETINAWTAVITDSALPTGAATSANQATIIASLQILDDVPAVQNGALVKGNPIMGQLDDTSTTVANEDAVAAVRITPQRAVHTNLRNQAGTEVGTTATPIKTQLSDGTEQQTISANGDAHVVDGIRAGGVYGRVSIPTSGTAVEMKVGASRLANRKMLQVYCNSTGLFWGLDNTVTTTSGTPLAMGQVLTFTIDPDSSTFQVWLVGNANTKTVQVTECP